MAAGVVEEWLAAVLDPSSQRHTEMENLARAVRRLLTNSFGYISPSTVVAHLLVACQRDGTTGLPGAWDHLMV